MLNAFSDLLDIIIYDQNYVGIIIIDWYSLYV